MFDPMTVQAEVDYRRERLAKGKRVRRSRTDRTRIPFVSEQTERRLR